MNKTGFGFLRLPRLVETDETSIDFSVVDQMVDRFLELGGVYFDTAYTYLGGASEKGIWSGAGFPLSPKRLPSGQQAARLEADLL